MPAKESPEQLLWLLSDGQFHSGTSLGEQLGISRTAVWKQLQKLEAQGVLIESLKGKGYRLAEGLVLLTPELIRTGFDAMTQSTVSDIRCLLSTASTNSDALMAIQNSDQDLSGLLVLAEEQTAGRGRRGRQWVSPFARNLYFSLVWSFEGGAAALEGLSLMVGLSVLKALKAQGCEGLQLKWPNDLWCNQRKLGGVLLEMSGDASGFCQVVIGVGVNVSMSETEAESIDQPWTSLLQQGCMTNRNQLVSAVMNQLVNDLNIFTRQGFAAFQSEWMGYDVCNGQSVQVADYQTVKQGLAKGVDKTGALLVDFAGEVERVIGGEVSLTLKSQHRQTRMPVADE